MKVDVLSPDEWSKLSENAHITVFKERRTPDFDRIDYAMIIQDQGHPLGFATVRENDRDSIYLQFGGTFPGTRGTIRSLSVYRAGLSWLTSRYKRATTLVENTNTVYLKMALTCGFIPIGIRNFHGTVLLELLLEFHGGNDVVVTTNGSTGSDGHGTAEPSAEGRGFGENAAVG